MARGLFTGEAVDGVFSNGLSAFLLNNGLLKIDYFLEMMTADGKIQRVFPLPEQPQSVDIAMDYAENPIYTFNGVYREVGPQRSGRAVISGEISNRPRLALRLDADTLNLRLMDGEDVLLNFKKILDSYAEKANAQLNEDQTFGLRAYVERDYSDPAPKLIFRAMKEDIHYYAAVENFTFSKSIDKKRLSGYTWNLTLRLYGQVEAVEPGIFEELTGYVTDALNFVATYTTFLGAGLTTVSDQVDVGLSKIRRSSQNLGDSIASIGRGFNSLTSTVIGLPAEILDSVTAALGGVYDLVKSVYADTGDVFDAANNRTKQSWESFKTRGDLSTIFEDDQPKIVSRETLSGQDAEVAALEAESQALLRGYQLQEYVYKLEQLLGVFGGLGTSQASAPQGRGFLAADRGFAALAAFYGDSVGLRPTRYEGPTRRYTMRSGESLLTVSTRLMGSPAQWAILAEINGCQDAYTAPDGGPLTAGTRILVPVTGAIYAHELATQTLTEEARAANVYGVDLALRDDDLYFDDFTGDAVLSLGEQNLMQGVNNILRTLTDEATMFPTLGTEVSQLIGTKFTEGAISYIAVKVREALLRDSRIADVQDIAIEKTVGDVVNISMVVTTVETDTLRVSTIL